MIEKIALPAKIAFLLLTLRCPSTQAQTAMEQDPHVHHEIQKIKVLEGQQKNSLSDTITATSVISGDELMKKRGVSLGETLNQEVGVSSTSYGPAASRPIIRGLGGDRVRILQNGLGILDASGASQYHAISLDPLSMDKIEIIRGPLSLLYGSSALGDVINILTNRTHEQMEKGFSAAADTQVNSVDNSKTLSMKAD